MNENLKEILWNAVENPENTAELLLGFTIFLFFLIGLSQGVPLTGASAGAFIASILSAIAFFEIGGFAIGLISLGLLALLFVFDMLIWIYKTLNRKK